MEHVSDLAGLALRVTEPRNYYHGVLAPELLQPTNVLVFHRRAGGLSQKSRSQHHRHVLICCLRSAATVIVDDVFVPLNPGQALLVFPYQFHSYREPQLSDMAVLFVTFDIERGTVSESLRQRAVTLSAEAQAQLHALLTQWLTPESAERNARVTLEAALLLHHLALSAGASPPRRAARQDPFDRTLARVCKNIQAHMHDGVRIKTLASDESMSESHLRLLFRTRMGLSLGDYLQSMRMVRATQLLAQSELSIEAIGARCGYGSIYAFSRAFKRALKQSPRAFRKAHA